ncbi:MAG: LamG-like jellyroll fold domain-containing protein [Bacteroidota bacterium]
MKSKLFGMFCRASIFLLFVAIIATNNLQGQTVSYSTSVRVSSAVASNVLDVSPQDNSPSGITFNTDGTKVFMSGTTNDNVYEYTLSTPYDLTSSAFVQSFDVLPQESNPTGLTFSRDGFRLFVIGTATDSIYQYNLSVPFTIATAVYSDQAIYVGNEENAPNGLFLADNGSKMYIVGSTGDDVHQYNLSVANEINSATYSGSFLDLSGELFAPTDLTLNADGSRLFVMGTSTRRVFTYDLSTPFDLSTAVQGRKTFNLASTETSPQGIAIDSTGTTMFITGANSRDILSYDLTDNAFVETGANDGTVEGSMIITVSGDSFNNTGMSLSQGTDYTISNLPSGLVPDISVSGSGSNAVLTLSGSAALHDDVNDVDNIMITFNNSALSSGDAGGVINAVSGNSNLRIDFASDIPTAITYANNPRISSADQFQTFDLSAFSTAPTSVVFSRDGSRMFTTGSINDMVYQFDLTVNFDVSTASLANQFSVIFEETNPTSVSFNTSGTRMFVMGTTNDLIHEVILDQPYDLSTAYYTGNVFDVSTEELSPEEMTWNNDGTRFFVVGSSGDDVNAYDVSTPFDITTASYSGVSLSVSAVAFSPTSLAFNADGSRLYVAGNSSDRIFTYNLTTGFDLSTASIAGITFNLAGFETSPQGLFLTEDGTKLYMTGTTSDLVHEFDLSVNTFTEAGSNDGRIEQDMILKLNEESFAVAAGSNLTEGGDYVIDNLPAGLSSVVTVTGDGTTAKVQLTGNATNHDNANDVNDLQFTFSNTAFSSSAAADVNNAVGGSSNLRIDFNTDLAASIAYYPEIKVSSAILNTEFDISAIEDSPTGVVMSPDGSKLFVCGSTNNLIYEFSLSINFDVSTAALTNQLNVLFEESNIRAIRFNPSGTRLYMIGTTSDDIHEYTLEAPFDLSSAIYEGAVLSLTSQELSPTGFYISPDGTDVFVVGQSSDAVHQYDLTVPFDFSTAMYSGNSFSVSGQTAAPSGLDFTADGTQMFTSGTSSDRLFSYDLSTPFDVSTAALANNSLNLALFDTAPQDIYFDGSGTRLLMVGSVNDRVYSYDLSNRAFIEEGGNTGTVEGVLKIQLTGDTFSNPGGTLLAGTDYTVTNLPAGLTPQMTVSADGRSADLTLSGTASAHDNLNDIASILITYNAATFGNSGTATIVNAISGNIGIDFAADIPLSVDYALPIESVGDFIAGSELDVTGLASDPESIVFSNDGSSMYILSNTDDDIHQFDLTTPFVVDGASLVSSFNIFFDESNGSGMAFNETGDRLFFVGTTNDQVNELILTTPFDLSTAFHTGKRLFVGTQEASPQELEFSNDGLKLFVVGSSSDNVYQYDLINPFDLDGATYSGILFGLGSQTSSPTGLAFNRDGSKMITIGSTSDRMFIYDLSTPFDVSTASYTEVTRSISAFETIPQSIYFDKTGSRLYLTGATQNRVTPFTLQENNAFLEKAANDGTVTGSMIISANEDLFTNAGGMLAAGTDYVVDNLPAGLIPDLQVASDGRTATLTLGGNATANDEANDLSDLQFTFSNSAFAGGDATLLAGAVSGSSDLGLDFIADPVATLSYSGQGVISTADSVSSFDFNTEDTFPVGAAFSNDGTKLFMVGNTNDRIFEYSLVTPFDLSSGSLVNQLNVAFEENGVSSMAFNPSGSVLFLLGTTNDDLLQFTLRQPFDLSTASFTGTRLSVGTEENSPSDFVFSADGMQVFVIGSSTDAVYQYDLLNPFDLTGGMFSGNSLPVGSFTTSPTSLVFNADGSRLYITGSLADRIFTFNLTQPFDLNFAASSGLTFNVGGVDTSPQDIFFNESETIMYMLGNLNDRLFALQLSENAFIETGANDGTVEGLLRISITEDTFTAAGSTLISGTDYLIDNLPAGLTPALDVAADGKTAVLTLSGTATDHQNLNDVDDLMFTFSNSAFTGGDATAVNEAVGGSSNLRIDFSEDINEIVYASAVDANAATNSTNLSVVTEDTNPTSVYFDRSGSKMFMLGNTSDDIYEYSLSTNFDVSTATLTANFDIVFEENNAGGLAFNPNGTRMFVVGSSTDRVLEYILDEPFDLATAYYSGVSADISLEENSASGITFSFDGLQMYIVGSSTDNIYAYDLTAPFDISSATNSGSALNISSVTTSPSGIRFNLDGTKLFVSGIISDQLFQYNLTTGFDISTATLAGSVVNFGLQDTAPVDFYLDESGTRLFMIGAGADSVYTYEMTDIAFAEPAANDGSVTGEMLLGIYGDTFANAGSSATEYTIDNLPSGLIPDMLVADDGRTARLTLSGNAEGHAGIDDITDLLFTFNAAAFVVNAATIQNSVGASSGLQIDFFGPAPPTELLTVEVGATQIDLTWIDQSADEDEFVIFRSTGGNTSFAEIASVGPDISFYSDLTVSADNSYFYYVVSRNAIGDSSPSNEAAASTLTQPGNALNFDGVDDEVLIPSLNAPTGSFTLEAWVKYEGTGSGFETIIEFGDDDPLFGLNAGTLTLSGGITAPKQFIRNVWAHIAVSYDLPTQDLRLYINGAEVAQETISLVFSGQGMGIGHLSGDSYFPGSIDEVRIWEVARSAAEISGAFTSDLVGNESGLLAYYKFDQTVSGFDLLPDRSINSFDGALTNFDFNGIDNGSDWATSEALVVVIPGPPVALAATDTTSMGFTANWELEPGIIDYVIDVSENDQFTELVAGFDNQPLGDVNSAIVTGLEYGTSYFYRLRGVICPGDTTIYSDTITVKTIIDAGTLADSAALVKIYDALGGVSWTDNSNWTVADQRIGNWSGVTLTAGRVTAIDLSGNNLVGSFPALATGELDQLVTLLLNDNAIEGLPDLRDLTALTDLQVQDNFLSFDDLEPNSGISGIVYAPQGILLEEEDILFNEGDNVVLDRTVGGTTNVYEWRKDAAVLAGETSSTLNIGAISFDDEGFYETLVTNVNVPGLTLITSPITVTISSLEKDSLALVAIYNATGGNDGANPWTGRDNWLNTDITQWEGLGFTGNRVTSVNLSGSNLRGAIPEDILDILNLESLVLDDNLLDSIPDLTGLANLTTLNVSNNLLEFDDLEANATITNFDFAGQEIPGSQSTVIRERGTEVIFSVDIKGSENVYQWQFDGINITGATESTFVIPDLSIDEMGVYRCIISNNLITPLDLVTPGDSLLATADVSGTVRGVSNTPIVSGTVLALRITETNTAYDSITPVVNVVDGTFTYPDLVLADYLFVVEASESIYIPTYVESGFLWDEADTVFLRDNGQSVTAEMVLDPDATIGPGDVGGIFEEDIPDDGRIEARRRVRRVGVALRRRRSSNRIQEDEFELVAYTQTDDNGQFTFEELPNGVYRISFEFPGVPLDESSFVEFEISEDDGRTSLELEAVATEDGTIVVNDVTPDPVSVSQALDKLLKVYPNPARNSISIDYSKVGNKSMRLELTDSYGREVITSDMKDPAGLKQIDISQLSKGVYILKLIDANNQSVATSRIIKH